MQSAPTEPIRDPLASLRIDRSTQRSEGSGRSIWRWLGFLLVVAFFAIVIFVGLERFGWIKESASVANAWVPDVIKNRPEVRIARLVIESGRSADATVVATGYIESRRQAKIGARAPGRAREG